MYTLMKSQRTKLGVGATEPRPHKQRQVAQYADFADAVAACDEANQGHADWHYVMNDAGKEFYAETWID